MSDSIDRSVPLPPARPAKLNLIRENRVAPQTQPAIEIAPEGTSTPPPSWPYFANADQVSGAYVPAPQPATTVSPSLEAATVPLQAAVPSATRKVSERITFDIPSDLRSRVRAAFKATRNDEDDDSFGDMMRKMVEAECERREALYNRGLRYTGDTRPLRSGRVIV